MKLKAIIFWTAVFGFVLTGTARPTGEDQRAQIRDMVNRLKYQSGQIRLRDGVAVINLTNSFRYLDPAGADTLLTGIWGNPPSASKNLGIIVPPGFSVVGSNSWCVVIDFHEDGYIKDDDAEKLNYTELLEAMKSGTKKASEERIKNGYPGIELVGWATPPRYDKATHKFYWAKELRFGDSNGESTLNYNLRVLGRKGVLELNAVAGLSQLKTIEEETPTILSMVEFEPGHRYTDFKVGTDKVATYGLAALVAGGIAAKTGLLKGLFIALLAAKKFVIMGFVALLAFVKRLFGQKQKPSLPSGTIQPPDRLE